MATENADEVSAVIAEQCRELEAAKFLESDLDAAFRLQMREAQAASLAIQPSSHSHSSSPAMPQFSDDDGSVLNLLTLQTEEIARFDQERRDRDYADAVMRSNKNDLKRRAHDQKLAADILGVPEEEWKNTGDYFERPFAGDGGSSSVVTSQECFRLYFKGLVSEERTRKERVIIAGIGVAICDPRGNLIFEMRKPLEGKELSRDVAELEALIECLNAAHLLDLKRVTLLCDDHLTYLYTTERWTASQGKIAKLIHQADLLKKKFSYCNPSLVGRNHIKFVYKLARDAIDLQVSRSAESSRGKNLVETCVICLEDVDVSQMFSVDNCLHRYCVSCMRQHVVVQLHQARAPKCPYADCRSKLSIDKCHNFLSPELVELMSLRIKEASIPVTEKVYCPYPRCSALMSWSEVLQHSVKILSTNGKSSARECMQCHNLFCVECKVPWHANMSCRVYKMANPHPCAEDAKLKSLATSKRWRQCMKCKHMVELTSGCNHISCRCGFGFCYICGAEWKNKKATCSCPLWDEHNLVYDENRNQRRRRR